MISVLVAAQARGHSSTLGGKETRHVVVDSRSILREGNMHRKMYCEASKRVADVIDNQSTQLCPTLRVQGLAASELLAFKPCCTMNQ